MFDFCSISTASFFFFFGRKPSMNCAGYWVLEKSFKTKPFFKILLQPWKGPPYFSKIFQDFQDSVWILHLNNMWESTNFRGFAEAKNVPCTVSPKCKSWLKHCLSLCPYWHNNHTGSHTIKIRVYIITPSKILLILYYFSYFSCQDIPVHNIDISNLPSSDESAYT